MKSILTNIKSLLDFIVLYIFNTIFDSVSENFNNLLIINTGQIGDLTIMSRLFENDSIYDDYKNVYFVVRREYLELFDGYSGRIEFIPINEILYRYNLLYRIRFNFMLKKLNIVVVYNLTSARPTWNDTLALGIGAHKKYCLGNNWKKLKKVFPKKTDVLYSEVLNYSYNEYMNIEKIANRINNFSQVLSFRTFLKSESYEGNKYDIVISPFSSSKIKDWSLDKFKQLVSILSNKWNIILVGSLKQKKALLYLRNNRKNVAISAGEIKLNAIFDLISNAKLFVGVDSGISHLAIKTTTKRIILVGGGTYGMYFPIPEDYYTVYIKNKLGCFGCEWVCNKSNNLCLSEIGVDEVLKQIDELMLR